MPPIPATATLGGMRAGVRSGLEAMVNGLIERGECFNRYEALRLLQEELACLEAEERAMTLVIRGWGETLNFGLLDDGAAGKLCTLPKRHPVLFDGLND